MTLNEMVLGNFQTNQGIATIGMGTLFTQKSGSRLDSKAFGDILGSRLGSAVRNNNANSIEEKPKFLSFKELKRASALESTSKNKRVSDKNNQSQQEDDDVASKESDIKTETPHNRLQSFSQLLGVDINALRKLLNEADISSEFFCSEESLQESRSRLSQLLGLNEEQEGTLLKMLQFVFEAKESQTTVGKDAMLSDINAVVQSIEAAEGSNTHMEQIASEKADTLQSASDFQNFALRLELQDELNKLAIKPETYPVSAADIDEGLAADLNEGVAAGVAEGSVEAKLKQLIQALMGKSSAKLQEFLQQLRDESADNSVGQVTAAIEPGIEKSNAEANGTGQEANGKAEKETLTQQPLTAMNETEPHAIFPAVQPGKVNNADVIHQAAFRTPVAAKEIINQVIENMKVTLTPDKSEMLVELKPDSLGKISVKVVTENGIVMAKFVAESQQVKQVLEANLQQLKDSMEKQGMSVQGFSVSVRQDSNRSAGNQTQSKNGKGHMASGNAYRSAGSVDSMADVLEPAKSRNPYTWGTNTINLTA